MTTGSVPIVPTQPRPASTIVVVANRLPVEADDDGGWRRSPGGLVTALESVLADRDAVWVGWSGRPSDVHDGDRAAVPDRMGTCELVDVGIGGADARAYLDGFCNATLWPLYHDTVVPPQFHRKQFDAYRRVNVAFAKAVAGIAGVGATVWVHDYQLQLVPAMLREMRPDLTIGFFLHIPFPPAELFLQLPWREQILRGLTGADLVGFQVAGAARNFAFLCERLLAARVEDEWITLPDENGGRTLRAAGFPISIDAAALDAAAQQPTVVERARQIRHDLGDPETILLGVDRLDYTKGIDVRMKAIVELFEDGDLVPGRAVMVQVATPSREMIEDYQRIRSQVESLAGRAMGAVGGVGVAPIHYLNQTLPLEELVALYVAADIMVVTPLRDGMNLVAKEYVAAHDGSGTLVLSEFAGAAQELVDAYLVNPHDADGVKRAIRSALRAPEQERRDRMSAMRRIVFSHDARYWADSFLTALAEVRGRAG